MTDRRCFLSFFVICLAVLAAAFFATLWGVPYLIWKADESHMTTAIAVLFVGSVAYLGRLSWSPSPQSSPAFGHLAVRLSVMLGMLGTTIGLSLQAKTLMTGTAGLLPLSTSLFSTGCGILAAIILEVLTHNLERGIERS